MKLKTSILDKIALMICGDLPYSFFPYRSSSYLTQFFRDIDLKYIHDGTTRKWWVQGVLEELNEIPEISPNLPSQEIKNAIENLLNPIYFIYNSNLPEINQDKAIDAVNEMIKIQNLVVVKKKNNSVSLFSINDVDLSSKNQNNRSNEIVLIHPQVFNIPEKGFDEKLVSVMMPFSKEFDDVYISIKNVCNELDLNCKRADDIWENSIIIQDIFELIYCSKLVIIDCSNRKPNVFYEAGIAHTLGKTVIPITQSLDDIPFDLKHHRVLQYLNNGEGLRKMEEQLKMAMMTLVKK